MAGHLAPSVHNTQPWQITINPARNTLVIGIGDQRPLPHSDPAYRQTWISLGALLENVVSVAEALQLSYRLHSDTERITIEFKDLKSKSLSTALLSTKTNESLKSLIQTIQDRHNNRNFFSKDPLPADVYAALVNYRDDTSACTSLLITDRATIDKLAKMAGQAGKLAFSSKNIRHELARHIVSPLKKAHTGIPARSINASPSAWFEKHSTRSNLFIARKAKKEMLRLKNSSALLLTFTAGDTVNDWLEAGREYERMCLKITQLGLDHSTNASLVEAPDYYKEVSELLDTPMRLQTLIRIGYGKPTRSRAKRLPIDQVLHVTDDPR